jgi:ketosteroid isomerase-like protein
MKNNFILSVTIFIFTLTACNTTPKTEICLTSTDSLMTQWNNAWNASDNNQITALLDDKAILVAAEVIKGKDSIRVKFIQPSTPGLRNLKTEKIYEAISADFVSQTGSYSHDWVKNDSVVENGKGFYTFIWQKQADKTWKLELIKF